MNELILLSSSLLIFITYLSIVVYKYGIQKSISDSYYRLPKKWSIVFLFFIWGFALPLGILLKSDYTILLTAIALICIVGITPNFKDYKAVKWMHMLGAFSGIIIAILSIIFEFKLYCIAGGLAILILLIYKFVKNPIWWIEIASFLTIWGVLLYER